MNRVNFFDDPKKTMFPQKQDTGLPYNQPQQQQNPFNQSQQDTLKAQQLNKNLMPKVL